MVKAILAKSKLVVMQDNKTLLRHQFERQGLFLHMAIHPHLIHALHLGRW